MTRPPAVHRLGHGRGGPLTRPEVSGHLVGARRLVTVQEVGSPDRVMVTQPRAVPPRRQRVESLRHHQRGARRHRRAGASDRRERVSLSAPRGRNGVRSQPKGQLSPTVSRTPRRNTLPPGRGIRRLGHPQPPFAARHRRLFCPPRSSNQLGRRPFRGLSARPDSRHTCCRVRSEPRPHRRG